MHNDECTVPRFSIVIPCYNVEKCLRACLDSVLAQSHDSWGAICVDDGATPYQRMALGLSWLMPVRIIPYCLCYVLPRLVQGGSVSRKLSNIKERIVR